MLTQHEISLDEHAAWFERMTRDATAALLVVEEEGMACGLVHFSRAQPDGSREWSFYKAPDAPRGSGLRVAAAALAHAFEVLRISKVRGQVLDYNKASLRLHEKLGFSSEGILAGQAEMKGQRHDLICFGLSRDAWLSQARGRP
jgi:RimJ/RimL family protein N-acetyltransferase